MKQATPALLCLLIALITRAPLLGQDAGPVPASPVSRSTEVPACGSHCVSLSCFRWTLGCFPRRCCADDYCPNPYPQPCWPPYPPFYRCAPAGDCTAPPCGSPGKEKLTWWFLPTPRALHEALWCQP
jgi:hypothetical protein